MRISDHEAARLAILKTIRRREPVSRTELVSLTGLSSTTITDISAELMARGILTDASSEALGPGRPRRHLRINPAAAYGVGAFLLHDRSMQVEVINARADKVFEARFWPDAASLEDLAAQIARGIDETIAISPLKKSAISRVGVAMHGTLDAEAGIVHWLNTFPPRPVPFARVIHDRLGLPVTVDNIVNVMARAEHWFGEDPQLDDFVLVHVGTGLGLSRYVDGNLQVGAHGMAAEFAHIKMGGDAGPPCICGARGCLATYATTFGIVRRAFEAEKRPPPVPADAQAAFDICAERARMGEPVCRDAFIAGGQQLGIAVGNIVNILDPARVLVLALDPSMADLLAAPFHGALEQAILPSLRGRTRVNFRSSEEISFAHGAAALVLEDLYRRDGSSSPSSGPANSKASRRSPRNR